MASPKSGALTKGPIAGHFRTLAVPMAVGMLFNTLYNVVDMFFAGLLSTSAQAGLALGFQTFYVAMSVGIGLAAAMGALVGNAVGAGDAERARGMAAQGLAFAALAALALVALGAWIGPRLIALVSDPGAYRAAGTRYYLLLSLALPAFLVAFAANGILQAHGDGRSMQRATMAAFFANIGLNPLMIFGIPGLVPGLGFDGLALSTVVSQMGVMLYLLRQVARLEEMRGIPLWRFRPRLSAMREVAAQAAPTTVSFLVMILSGFVVQFALKAFGEHAVAGFGIAIRLEQILLLPVLGVTGALLPIAAQNFGAGAPDRVRAAFVQCLRIGLAMTALAIPILWIFGRAMLSLFTDDAEVLRVGLAYLRIESVILPVYMALFAINSLLQALKRPVWTLWISLYRQGVGIALFVWIFVGLFGLDERGVWFGVACAVTTGLGLAWLIAARIARHEIGGLWRGRLPDAAQERG